MTKKSKNMNVDIVIITSGILESMDCSLQDFKNAYELYLQGFVVDKMRIDDNYDGIYSFIEMMFNMSSFEGALTVLHKKKKSADQFRFDIEVKKSAGTSKEWIKEITLENEQNEKFVDTFFTEFSKIVKPINRPNPLN